MRLIGRTLITSLLTLVLTIPAGAIADEDPHAKHRAMMKQKSEPALESADVDLRDRPLLTQDGEEVLFVSDVIGDNIVVMDFVYTTCTTICPVLSAIFTQVQGKLGHGDSAAARPMLRWPSQQPRRRWCGPFRPGRTRSWSTWEPIPPISRIIRPWY